MKKRNLLKFIVFTAELVLLQVLSYFLCHTLKISNTVAGTMIYGFIMFAIFILLIFIETKIISKFFPGFLSNNHFRLKRPSSKILFSKRKNTESELCSIKIKKIKRRIIRKEIIYFILAVGFFVAMFSFRFSTKNLTDVQISEILFYFVSPVARSARDIMITYYAEALIPAILCGLVFYFMRFSIHHSRKIFIQLTKFFNGRKFANFATNKLFTFAVIIPIFGMYNINPNLWGQLKSYTEYSDFIEENYVDPGSVSINWSNEKRNLIIIYLESMEVSFSDTKNGGALPVNLIPNLTTLAKNNINFSADDNFGGGVMLPGSTWTAGSLFTQTSALPLIPQVAPRDIIESITVPSLTAPPSLLAEKLVTLGDILYENGYTNYFLCGSDANFGARKAYLTTHNYNVYDAFSAQDDKIIPKDYWEWWGFEDEILFDIAKDQVLEAAKNQPFNFSMLTADTHYPDGYNSKNLPEIYDDQYFNVIRFSDSQVYDFLKWLSLQDFYKNTTVVIVGDHCTMDTNMSDKIGEKYKRSPINIFMNLPDNLKNTKNSKNRIFSHYDMMPTILSASGASLESSYLGLGADLFSGVPTLLEIYDESYAREELSKNSLFYKELVSGNTKE